MNKSAKCVARAAALAGLLLQAACHAQPTPEIGCHLAGAALDELSGLAPSADGSYWWGHNDSGGTPQVFRTGPCGEDLGAVEITGARNRDWEDIAAFDDHGTPSLLIGDIGDNTGARKHVRLYAVAEPGPDASETSLSWQQDFTYPGGPRDAEALAVDPGNGDILVMSKRDDPPHLYRVPRGDGTVLAEDLGAVGTIHAPLTRNWLRGLVYELFGSMPTAMDISRDGSRIAVMTLTELFVWTRAAEEPWVAVMNRKPRRYTVPSALQQAEAMAFCADGTCILMSSERAGAPMFSVELK